MNAPIDFLADHLALASNNTTSMILAFDPSARLLRFDTVAADSRFTITAPDSASKLSTEVARSITVWRKGQDGKWRCVMDYATPD